MQLTCTVTIQEGPSQNLLRMHWTMVLTQTMVYWTIVVPSEAKVCFVSEYHSQKKELWRNTNSYTFKNIPCTIVCHLWSPLLLEMECLFVILVLGRKKGNLIHFFVDFLDVIVVSEIEL